MAWFRKAFYWLAAFSLLFSGLWLVIVNDQRITLNLLFWRAADVNAGAAVLGGFIAGAFVGVLVGLNLYSMLRLKGSVWRLRRELKQTQQALRR